MNERIQQQGETELAASTKDRKTRRECKPVLSATFAASLEVQHKNAFRPRCGDRRHRCGQLVPPKTTKTTAATNEHEQQNTVAALSAGIEVR